MITQTPRVPQHRDPWYLIWQVAVGDNLLVLLLLAVAVGLLAAVWLPQAPTADPQADPGWLSETQARFGATTQTLQALGLFSIAQSFGFRTLLALLGGVLFLRLVERGHRLLSGAERRDLPSIYSLLAHTGGLLLLVGLLITHRWSWRVEGLIVQSGDRTPVPGTTSWIALDADTLDITHSAGIAAFVESHGPGLRVSATDGQGNPLSLQPAEADPRTELTLALPAGQHFAIPDAQLMVQLIPQADQSTSAQTPVLVQIYHHPPIQLEAETVIQGDAKLTVDDITLHFASMPYAQVVASSNTGLWPTVVGLLLTIVGIAGSIVQTVRRSRADAPGTGEED
jgi:hypothetical protein